MSETFPRSRCAARFTPNDAFIRLAAIGCSIVVAFSFGAVGARAADVNATPSTLSSVYAAAKGGDVIHLAAGDYGRFNGDSSNSGVVTLIAQAGATVSMNPYLSPATNLRFDGLTINGAYLNGVTNVAIVNSRFTDMLRIDTPLSVANANVLIDHDSFANIDVCSTCFEGRLAVRGYDNKSPVGVTISNNTFGPGGNADGIQIIGDAYGVQIGPGNEFAGLAQGSGANVPHTDPIQLYGSQHTLITGNWLHNNATGIMAPDGTDHETITNNVIATTGYPWAIAFGGAVGDVIDHNTFPTAADVDLGTANNGTTSSGNTVTNNVNPDVENANGPVIGATMSHNLGMDIPGTPVYMGGSSPSSYLGYQLTTSSPGHAAAADGTDLGPNFSGVVTPPPVDTTPPDTTITSGPSGTTTSTSATYAFTSTEAGSTFQCRLDSAAWASCTSPWTVGSLTVAAHTIAVRATDGAGNTDASPATVSLTVQTPPDITPPDTTITSGPSGTTTSTSATYAFTSTEAGSTFQCRLDSAAWASCTSPWTVGSLTVAAHTIAVRATDGAGNTDASPATVSLTVQTPPDITPPDTTITSGPSGTTTSTSATYAFTSTEAGSTFQCRLDSAAWASCTSPWTVGSLSVAAHTIAVRATDGAGNTDTSPATVSLTVQAPPPPTTTATTPAPPPPTTTTTTPAPPPTPEAPPTDPAVPPTPAPPALTIPPPLADPPLLIAQATPTVTISKPTDGATFTSKISIAATAKAPGGIDHVDFLVGGKKVGSDASSPYSRTWTAATSTTYGKHTITVRAFGKAGGVGSASVVVTRVHATARFAAVTHTRRTPAKHKKR